MAQAENAAAGFNNSSNIQNNSASSLKNEEPPTQ
ncbi:uncharacterized protein PADG_12493 [Paracoccidioides brasiliensis Pb18]|uniref:Uncharacterized protein n=1 Tax=Paracoccidioides brasiliensis (strain Pb18) TaxID=502780 RepID=A0A0A0HTU1_PARBD|nr:uncharacterized protein PADG_12493 [Paracoccidioides brasiliensis Pb18]KGM91416.1 hypothetical protein PADG_12493 [Paracoccidioides brasiliensis Pb18]